MSKKYVRIVEIDSAKSNDHEWEVNNLIGECFKVPEHNYPFSRENREVHLDISNSDPDNEQYNHPENVAFFRGEIEFISGLEYYMWKIKNE